MKTNIEVETSKHPRQISFLPFIGVDRSQKFILISFLVWSVFFSIPMKKANQRNK